MRKDIKIPRILKINRIEGLTVSVVFNNGESRIIDFCEVFKSLGINRNSPAGVLFEPLALARAEIENNTLSWSNVEQYISLRNNEKHKVPFAIGADVLLSFSRPDTGAARPVIGKLIRNSRVHSGLTQAELARRSGTTRNYISRIENDRSDIALSTLKKIIESGLGKKLEISIT